MTSVPYVRSVLVVGMLVVGVFSLVGTPKVMGQQRPPQKGGEVVSARQVPSIQAASPRVQRAVERAFHGPDGVGKDGPMAAVGRDLIALHRQYEAHGPAGVNRLMGRTPAPKEQQAARRGYSPVSADGRFVTVNVVAEDEPSVLLDDLRQLGLQDGATAGNLVSGRLPIAQIEAAAGLGSLRGMQAAYARTHGSLRPSVADSVVISEADTAHSAVEGRASLGVDGSGEKICALSDSYDSLGDASTNVSNGELPGSNNPHGNTAPVDVLADLSSESDEGRAMLQLIHDIAPGAELGFHTAFNGLANFAQGIRDLADAGCTVIVDDVGYSNEPFYQDGPVANAIDDVVNNDDVAYFSSAGNDGQNSYEAPFRNSGNAGIISSSSVRHDFDGSSSSTDTEQQITVEAGGTFQVWTLQWTDPSALVSGTGADTDLDVALVDAAQDTLVAQDADNNDEDGSGEPVEGPIEYANTTGSSITLNLVIEKAAGPDPDQVKYIYKGSGFTIDDQYGDVGTATIYGHPMAAGAEAVAAAPFYYTSAYRNDSNLPWLEAFSSKGGLQVRFDQSGSELSTYETRNKPDVTGTDGNDNTFFGNDVGSDGDSHPNFFGTSAAAPNVAAIAALVREANPGYGPTDVYGHLETNAKDVTRRVNENNQLEAVASGEDPWSGHGFVQADAAALPVELAAFGATVRDGRALLRWTTASETNNAGFTVEHRRGDGAFRDLGFVESKASGGTTTASTSYRYRTTELRVGTHTFRLRQQDLDGTTTRSQTVTVEVTLSGSHRVSSVTPNPVRRGGTVSITVGTNQPVHAAVYNALGQRVAVLHDGPLPANDPVTLQVGRALPSGVYLLRVRGESFSTTRKFVRVR